MANVTAKEMVENPHKYYTTIKQVVSKNKYSVTPGDISAETGFPIQGVNYVLKKLAAEYWGEIRVSEDGNLLYIYPSGFTKGKKHIKEVLSTIGSAILAGLALAFKIWIVVMLVAYFVVYIIIILALIVLSFSSSKGKSSGSSALFKLLARSFQFAAHASYVNAKYKERRSMRVLDQATHRAEKRHLYKDVFAYVFGEPDVNTAYRKGFPLIFPQLVLHKNGVIIAEELSALSGESWKEANQSMLNYLVRFNGEPVVSDSGTISYRFPQLNDHTQELVEEEYSAIANYYEMPYTFNENSVGKNVGLSLMNAFNLIMGVVFATGTLSFIEWDYIVLGYIPIAFSVLFFLVPIVRSIVNIFRNKQVYARNLYRAIVRTILSDQDKHLYIHEILGSRIVQNNQITNYFGKEVDLFHYPNEDEVKEILNQFAAHEHCTLEYDKQGAYYFDFSNLAVALEDVKQLRSQTQPTAKSEYQQPI